MVDVKDLSFSYRGDYGELQVLDRISFQVAQREFVSVIGPSGCGKTTLLRCLAGLLTPKHGNISIGTVSPQEARSRREMGFMFQESALPEWRTVVRNIVLPLELAGVDKNRAADRVSELVNLVALNGFEQHRPSELSGGMRQRVAIARALALRDSLSILLMDEPFGALDLITRERMNLELLRILSEVSCASLFVTHSIAEATFLADKVIVFSRLPARIIRQIDVPLSRPRHASMRNSPQFQATITRIRQCLETSSE